MDDSAQADSCPVRGINTFAHPDTLFRTLAGAVIARLSDGVARNGRASLVLAGGTTPGPLYEELARRDAPWSDVAVTLSDERWVDSGSTQSTEHLARTKLLTERAAAARLYPLRNAVPHARAAEPSINATIAAMPRPFDVVLLGMGMDGHVASLIPGATGLGRALDRNDPALVRAVHPTDIDTLGERMTLTLRGILESRWIVLLIRGHAKLAAYHHALSGHDVLEAPVRAVLHQSDVPVSVYWSE